jgi:hypothetical protein
MLIAAAMAPLLAGAAACGIGDEGCEARLMFVIGTPGATTIGDPETHVECACCPHLTHVECNVKEWDLTGEDGSDLVRNTSLKYDFTRTCGNFIEAQGSDGRDYHGTTLRDWGSGTGPFAKGTWMKDGDEGTFSLFERPEIFPY